MPLAELLSLMQSRGAHMVLGEPFNSNFLAAGAYYDYAPVSPAQIAHRQWLHQLAARYGVYLPVAALQFGMAHPVVAATISGASSASHLERNAMLMEIGILLASWGESAAEGLVPQEMPLPVRRPVV